MAINKPIIASQGTRTREQVRTVVFPVSGYIPPAPRYYIPEGESTPVYYSQEPAREGQVILYRKIPYNYEKIVFYVAVVIEGELVWKPAVTGMEFFDYRTGQQWDPLAGAYSYLVPYEP